MTVIAWDGVSLAADKMVDCNGYPATTTKIMRAPDGALIGGAGDSDAIATLRRWYIDGAKRADYPDNKCEGGGCRGKLMVITPKGQVTLYMTDADPIQLDDSLFAIGSGADFALAALHLERSSYEAVLLASKLDVSCGNGADVLYLHE